MPEALMSSSLINNYKEKNITHKNAKTNEGMEINTSSKGVNYVSTQNCMNEHS